LAALGWLRARRAVLDDHRRRGLGHLALRGRLLGLGLRLLRRGLLGLGFLLRSRRRRRPLAPLALRRRLVLHLFLGRRRRRRLLLRRRLVARHRPARADGLPAGGVGLALAAVGGGAIAQEIGGLDPVLGVAAAG